MAWGEPKQRLSFDAKLMFAFHGVMMLLFLAASRLTVPLELAIAGGWATLIALASTLHKRRAGWRWPGADAKAWLGALAGLGFAGVLAFVAAQNLPANRALLMPRFLAVAGIAAFNLLKSLNLVRGTQVEFQADITPPKPAFMTSERSETAPLVQRSPYGWQAWVVRAYTTAGLILWLTFMGFMYLDQKSVHDGHAAPTAAADWPLTEHGRTVYIPARTGQAIAVLKRTVFIAFPSFFALGFLIHFGLGVRLFSNLPTWRKDGP